jgi:hypothetical protein
MEIGLMRTATRLVATISLALSSFLIAGCQTGSTAMDFTLVQALPHIDFTDVGAKGDSPGDTEEFYAPLTRDGKPAGHVSGVLMIEDMPPEALRSSDAKVAIPPLYGALLKNEQDVHLFERLAFLARREGGPPRPGQ